MVLWLPPSSTRSHHGGLPFLFLIKHVLLLISYTDENKNQNLSDAAKAGIIEKFIAVNYYIEKRSGINYLAFTLRH